MQAAPDVLREPVGNGWCDHSENGNLHSLSVQDGVGGHVGLARCRIDDVGPQHRAIHLVDPLVVAGVSRLNVMIAESLGIVLHIVDDIGSHIGRGGIDVVEVVARGLSLQDVAIVDKDDVVAKFLAQTVYVSTNASQRSALGLASDEVVREERTVHITGFNDAQAYSLILFLCHCRTEYHQCQKTQGNYFFHVILGFMSQSYKKKSS